MMAVRQRITESNLAQEYHNADFIYQSLFPLAKPVTNRLVKFYILNKDAFRIIDSIRAEFGDSNLATSSGRQEVLVNLPEHDMEFPIDLKNTDPKDMNEERKIQTQNAQSAIELNHEKYAADISQNSDSYPAGHSIVLSGTSQFTDAASDPVGVVKDGRIQVRKTIGKYANRLVMGVTVFEALIDHPQLVFINQFNQRFPATLEALKERFQVDEIAIGKSVHVDKDGNFVDLWKNHMVLAYVDEEALKSGDKKSVNYGLTLRQQGHPKVDEVDINPGKVIAMRSTDVVKSQIIGPQCGYFIQDAIPAL